MLSRYRVMECGSSYRIRERHKAVRRTAFQAAAAKLMFSMLFVASVVYAERHEYSRPLMGMAFRIIVYSENEAKAKRAAKAAFDRVAVLNQIMSDYEPKSELSKLSNLAGSGKEAKISDELCSVLDRAQAARGADRWRVRYYGRCISSALAACPAREAVAAAIRARQGAEDGRFSQG